MELTNDLLIKYGFKCDNINISCPRFYKKNENKPEWGISISKLYKPYSNKMTYNVDCWLCNNNGIIIKKSSLSDVTTNNELQQIIDLCKIEYKLKMENI